MGVGVFRPKNIFSNMYHVLVRFQSPRQLKENFMSLTERTQTVIENIRSRGISKTKADEEIANYIKQVTPKIDYCWGSISDKEIDRIIAVRRRTSQATERDNVYKKQARRKLEDYEKDIVAQNRKLHSAADFAAKWYFCIDSRLDGHRPPQLGVELFDAMQEILIMCSDCITDAAFEHHLNLFSSIAELHN